MKRVIIVGAGFAGLNAAKILGRSERVHVTVIDRRNHHLFQPLLYQVAMAGLSPAEIAVPIRSILSQHQNLQVLQMEVTSVDLDRKNIIIGLSEIPYDYLILACGSKHAYFGHEEWENNAPGLKTIEQATEIRRRVLTAFENAEAAVDRQKQKQYLTFVIVGGGPTGVELAGAIGEMSRFTLAKDFRNIDPKITRVILVEAGPRILPTFSEKLASRAVRDLEGMGVQVWTSSMVTNIDAQGVAIGNERVEASTVLWAAGVQVSSLGRNLDVQHDRQGRIVVRSDLSIPDYPDVFAAGDMAAFVDETGQSLPGQAPAAMQQGRFIARNILSELNGAPRQEFKYRNKGQMATIGRSRAIVEVGKLQIGGFVAWLIWLVVHIYYLTGFKNRTFVVWQWALSYLTFRRGARLIVNKEWRSYQPANTTSDCQ